MNETLNQGIDMQLGWIDFSKDDREKVFEVLDLLAEPGILDELGIAPIRDMFSDRFFPGTSTLQRRAKYFLIVPYALMDLQKYPLSKINFDTLDDIERDCAEKLYRKGQDEWGIIGSDSVRNGGWVKNPPSRIYLAGLKRYGIFNYKSLGVYISNIKNYKNEDEEVVEFVNKNEVNEFKDDENAGKSQKTSKLLVPEDYHHWKKNLSINLTSNEAAFLKKRIMLTCKNSLMAQILNLEKSELKEILGVDTFQDLESVIHLFSEDIQKDYHDAVAFSEFNYVLRVIYNIIISNGENEEACDELEKLNLVEISNFNIDKIISNCKVNVNLRRFLIGSKECMIDNDIPGLKKLISKREQYLKKDLARTLQPPVMEWFGGRRLDYRFRIGKRIIQDIYEGENNEFGGK